MTRFLMSRQVFEKFFDLIDLFKNHFTNLQLLSFRKLLCVQRSPRLWHSFLVPDKFFEISSNVL